MVDITVVGSCTMDLTSGSVRIPNAGEVLPGSFFEMTCGGRGANQCCQAAKLGAKTGMVGVIGKDIFGDKMMENFKELDINADMVRRTDEADSGIANILLIHGGVFYTVIVPNANLVMGEDDINRARKMITKAKVVVCQLEILPNISLITLRMAREAKVTTILNTAPVCESLNNEHKDIFTFCDIVVANEVQARQLTNMEPEVPDEEAAKKAGKLILQKGCKSVIITLGEKGCMVTSAKFDGVLVPALAKRVVDTSAAGDSFVGALAYFKAYMPSLPLDEVCRRANLVSARSVEIPGTQNSFPGRNQFHKEVIGEKKP